MPVGRRFGGRPTMLAPSMPMSPLSGTSNPPISLRSVDFPQPDGPSRQTKAPSAISSVTSSIAATSPNRFDRPRRLTRDKTVLRPSPASCAEAGGDGARAEDAPRKEHGQERRHPEEHGQNGSILDDELVVDQRDHQDGHRPDIRGADQEGAVGLVEGGDEGQEQRRPDRRARLR